MALIVTESILVTHRLKTQCIIFLIYLRYNCITGITQHNIWKYKHNVIARNTIKLTIAIYLRLNCVMTRQQRHIQVSVNAPSSIKLSHNETSALSFKSVVHLI